MALAIGPAPGKLGQGGSMEQSPHPEGFDDIADCCFVVRGVELRVHSQILALHSPLFAELFAMTEDKDTRLSACLDGVPLEAMQLLLQYCYARCPCDFIKGMTNCQLEAVAPLADRFSVAEFLADADVLLHERVRLGCEPPAMAESSLEWALLAERCRLPRLQAKCEAWLAGNFNALKGNLQMQALSKEAWARLMYASHYNGPRCKEAMLRAWIGNGAPPYANSASCTALRAPVKWDFRGMDI